MCCPVAAPGCEPRAAAKENVLVGADGGGSRVRRQFLPHAERVDTGVIGIAGKVFEPSLPSAANFCRDAQRGILYSDVVGCDPSD